MVFSVVLPKNAVFIVVFISVLFLFITRRLAFVVFQIIESLFPFQVHQIMFHPQMIIKDLKKIIKFLLFFSTNFSTPLYLLLPILTGTKKIYT